METNLEVLNKISAKLGGNADATSVTESLNNIANALGDTNPDVIKSVSDSLNDILEYAGGGGGSVKNPKIAMTITNNSSYEVVVEATSNVTVYENDILEFKIPAVKIPSSSTGTAELYYIPAEGEGTPISYDFDLNNIVFSYDGVIAFDDIVLTNAYYDDDSGRWIITDPTKDAAMSFSVKDDGGDIDD